MFRHDPDDDQEENNVNEQPAAPVQADDGLAAAHQALLQREGPIGFQPYRRPKMFPLLIFGLIVLMLLSWLVVNLVQNAANVYPNHKQCLWLYRGHPWCILTLDFSQIT